MATWTWPRIGQLVGWRVIGVITAPVLWHAVVPVALDITLGEEPDDLTESARICEGGNPFGRAPAYAEARSTRSRSTGASNTNATNPRWMARRVP